MRHAVMTGERRPLLVLASLGLLVGVLWLGVIAPREDATARACPGPATAAMLRFGGGDPTPVCDVKMSLSAWAGRPVLWISVALPARGPYGSGRKRAELVVNTGLWGDLTTAGASLSIDPDSAGIGLATGSAYSGPCHLEARSDALEVTCSLVDVTGAALPMVGELPPAPDPHHDPAIKWLRVSYAFRGDYSASAVVEVASNGPGSMLQFPLADGALLTIVPAGNDQGQVAWLVLPALDPPSPGRGPYWRPDAETPKLGRCDVTLDDDAGRGAISCAGDPISTTGSASLEMDWRTLP